jgi:tetrapyrrole methylase family protein / MazG family protein
MEQFDALLHVAEKLLGPNGCAWDLKQTFQSLQPYVLEEAHEVIEAVDLDDDQKIVEELGDLLYNIVFYAKLGEKTGRFTMQQIVSTIKEKLIRRHPHIFGDVKVENVDDIVSNWEKIKKQEKSGKSKVDEMPPTLPGLVRGQKILKRVKKLGFELEEKQEKLTEEEIGDRLLSLLTLANQNEVDAESALRRALNRLMEHFHKWEALH